MINEQDVIDIMSKGLLKVSEKKNIGLKDLRVQMRLTEGLDSVECFALQGVKVMDGVKWATMLGLKAMMAKGQIVQGITERLHKLAGENDIKKEDVNARIYAVNKEGKPNIYLYNSGKPVKVISVSDLLLGDEEET